MPEELAGNQNCPGERPSATIDNLNLPEVTYFMENIYQHVLDSDELN
jgi:hypothetical protein